MNKMGVEELDFQGSAAIRAITPRRAAPSTLPCDACRTLSETDPQQLWRWAGYFSSSAISGSHDSGRSP